MREDEAEGMKKLARSRRTGSRSPTFAEQTSAIDDPSGPMGIRLVLQSDGDRETVRAKDATLIVPVHTGVVEVDIGGGRHLVDRAGWVLVPPGRRAVMVAKSPIAHSLALSVSDALRTAVVHAYGGEIRLTHFDRYVNDVQVMARTTWVNELVHRYLFERAVCHKRDNVATAFLEMELVKELYFLCHERYTERERSSIVEKRTSTAERAMAVMEAHLFEPEVVALATKACGASASSLLRAFKKELGQSPLGYVRARRLDESLLLLKSKRFAVGEVAMKVGYQNFAAFSQAFRARFGMKPSEVQAATQTMQTVKGRAGR